MDLKRLQQLAGIPLMESSDKNIDASQLEKAIHTYIDGWGGFPDNPDSRTKQVMNAVQELHGVRDLTKLTASQQKQAELILSYHNQ